MSATDTQSLTPKAQRTRKAIISAARKMIGISGVDGVTVLSVCEGANIGRTSFYNYFVDTQALLETLASDVGQEVQVEFEAMHGGLERGLERLERCLFMLLKKAASDPEFGLLITALAHSYPAFSEILGEQMQIELAAAIENRALELTQDELEIVVNFQVVAVLALMRDFALRDINPADLDGHVQCLMRAIIRPT